MTTVTETRLNAYLAAEKAILKAQEVRSGDRSFRQAELKDVREQITILQRQLAREQSAQSGRGSIGFSLANLSGG